MIEVSVVIAAWNAADTIARSVESACAQVCTEAEVIVVDDASQDDTAEVARRLGARVERLAANGGPSAARNRALRVARGEWLAVLDADDAMTPDRLRRLVALGRARGADVVLGNLAHVDPAGRPLGDGPFVSGPGFEAPRTLTLEDYVAGNQVRRGSRPLGYLKPLLRSTFLRAHALRYDKALRNGEDCHLVLACLAAGARVVFCPDPLYLYTARPGSISHRADPDHLVALLEADGRFMARLGEGASPRLRALMASRGEALRDLVLSERVMQALKRRDVRAAARGIRERPRIVRRVGQQLGEALMARASR